MNTFNTNPNLVLTLLICLPLTNAFLLWILNPRLQVIKILTVTFSTILFITSLFVFVNFDDYLNYKYAPIQIFENIFLEFSFEPVGLIFMLVASSLWVINTFYSFGYMEKNKEKNLKRFYICFSFAIFSTVSLALANNLVTSFIFYEILTLTTFPLVAHHGNDKAKKGATTYLFILMSTSIVFFLVAIATTWITQGSITYTNGGILSDNLGNPIFYGFLYALFIFGVSKAAVMPFHKWLPAAMVAPTPVSALLHAVAVVKAGVFLVIKISIYIFGILKVEDINISGFITFISSFTIIAASFVALYSDNLKRRLAYSTISQLSYIVLATSLSNFFGIIAAIFHLVAHAFGKITLFFAAGNIYTATHKTEISEMTGIGRKMPFTLLCFLIGSLVMIGLPLTSGFVSKWFLISGIIQHEMTTLLVMVIILSTILNAAYFIPFVYRAFQKPQKNELSNIEKLPKSMVISIGFCALFSIYLFFDPGIILNIIRLTGIVI